MADLAPPLVALPDVAILLANIALWLVGHVGAGYRAHRLSADDLAHDGPLLRLRSFERDGRWYERRLRIGSWKDRLPEAGTFFAGGTSKRQLPTGHGSRRAALERFLIETRRAERAHWGSLVVIPVAWVWNPPTGVVLMAAYGVLANLPFIAVQRYNRARITRILDRPDRRTGPPGPFPSTVPTH